MYVCGLQASKDIVRVVEWKDVQCFSGSNYKKFYRSPGPHCFSLVVSVCVCVCVCVCYM